jgi:peptidyl-prolyl cis-trans isomerase C
LFIVHRSLFPAVQKDLTVAFVAALVVAGVCYGLAQGHPYVPPPPSPASSPAKTNGPAAPRPNDRVVMHVNGEPVTEREFNAFRAQAPEQMQQLYMAPEGRRMLAQEIVKFKALEQEGRRLGIDKDPETVGRIDMARSNIIAGFTLKKLVAAPDEARLRAEYDKEKHNLETQQLSHILIAYQGGSVPPRQGAPLSQVDAMKKAAAIEAALGRGISFEQIARSDSDDTGSAANGGSLGPVSPGALPPELQGVVATMKDGGISKPVKSSFGIHIFKSGARQGRPFEELKPAFAAKIQRQEAEVMVGKLQKNAKVELDPTFFRQQSAVPQTQRPRPSIPR